MEGHYQWGKGWWEGTDITKDKWEKKNRWKGGKKDVRSALPFTVVSRSGLDILIIGRTDTWDRLLGLDSKGGQLETNKGLFLGLHARLCSSDICCIFSVTFFYSVVIVVCYWYTFSWLYCRPSIAILVSVFRFFLVQSCMTLCTCNVQGGPKNMPLYFCSYRHPGLLRATAGPGETFLWGPQTFPRGLSGEKILEFFLFKMVHSGVLYKFLADGGAPQTSRGPG